MGRLSFICAYRGRALTRVVNNNPVLDLPLSGPSADGRSRMRRAHHLQPWAISFFRFRCKGLGRGSTRATTALAMMNQPP
jgi:hypothetical protein